MPSEPVQVIREKPGFASEKMRRKVDAASKLKALAPEFVPNANSRAADAEGQWDNDQVASREAFLVEMLAAMDVHMRQLREAQQTLVAMVEQACRNALKGNFARLILVGSAALGVETPGSDVDVVCFTRRDGKQAAGLPVTVLRKVHWCLKEIATASYSYFSTELIDDARVPILRVTWCYRDTCAVDISVDQKRPLDHVRWFQRVGCAPRPNEPPPPVAPLVTLTLRCVKWWLKQRQMPRTKEGGLPTIAWLLMAVHVCSLNEHNHEALKRGRSMVALLSSMAAFFRHYRSLERLDGVLSFSEDGHSSEFRLRQPRRSSWAELSVLDPTRQGAESLELVPRFPPATQLLLGYELQRGCESMTEESRETLEDAFRAVPEGINALPSFIQEPLFALVVCGEVSPGTGIQQVELASIDRVTPRPGWMAPFLLRSDERSEVLVHIMDLEERNGRCRFRHMNPVSLCPANFVCQVFMSQEVNFWRIDEEGLVRFKSMRQIIVDLLTRRRLTKDAKESNLDAALQNVTNLPARNAEKDEK